MYSRGQKWQTSDFLYFRIQVSNTIEPHWNTGAPPHINTLVVPTQIRKKNHLSATYVIIWRRDAQNKFFTHLSLHPKQLSYTSKGSGARSRKNKI